MELDINNWKNFWETWDIRGFIILSLSLQALLILFGPLRKSTARGFILILLWLAYLMADAVAIFVVGLIFKSQQRKEDDLSVHPCPCDNAYLLALWSPFLLVHLGGPDTITAFALEDNELWLRHLLQLLVQSGTTAYVFILTLSTNKFWLPTLLTFLAGLIKYSERTRSLYLASTRRFKKSFLTDPDAGPNYAKLMDEYSSKKSADLPTRVDLNEEPVRAIQIGNEGDKRDLSDIEVIKHAYMFCQTFKGLIADLIFSFRDRNLSRGFFLNRTAKDAFKIVEVELNFLYEILYTKVVVIQGLVGYCLRFISFCSVVVAFSLFASKEKKELHPIDIRITYALFIGGISLDITAFFMLILSDSTAVALTKSEYPSWIIRILAKLLFVKRQRWVVEDTSKPYPFRLKLVLPLLHGRWSECISQYNLIHYCLHTRSERMEKVIDALGLTDILDGLKYVNTKRFDTRLRDFIFEELRLKSVMAKDVRVARQIASARGEWVLGTEDCDALLPYVLDVNYDDSLIVWHIATELLYGTDRGNDGNKDLREFSKLLSDYMFYLLIMQPNLMPAAASISQKRFRDTCAEAKDFFLGKQKRKNKSSFCIPCVDKCFFCSRKSENEQKQSPFSQSAPGSGSCREIFCCFLKWGSNEKKGLDFEHTEACKSILAVNTELRPVEVKGDKSKSVLFDGSILAKELNKLEENQGKDKWEIMSKVWVELMSYAACHCRASTHAAQLCKGGQLITVVWLLMAHLGLGVQFELNEGNQKLNAR
ncbi:uncharacterized protein LOC127795609 [Diospyros lotus]|uniref:uncharacterized protein LOC127795609 n=1 Tax=Diospyros lotus TaxID=55363 RepID=UPI0022551887|nr:uncharacterized protein LOC127795609 [Diospyros lotus]